MSRMLSSFNRIPLGLSSCDGPAALAPILPSVFNYRISDVLVCLCHASCDKYETSRLKRYFAAQAQVQKYELRCRLVAFLAGAAYADSVGIAVQRRQEGVRARTELNISRNPRMPAERQEFLRADAEAESKEIFNELHEFRNDDEIAKTVSSLPTWVSRPEVLEAALVDGSVKDGASVEGIRRGQVGQNVLERWCAAWKDSQVCNMDQNKPRMNIMYNSSVAPSKGGMPLPLGTKSEVDGMFWLSDSRDAETSQLLAFAEAKHGCTTLYDDIYRMNALLEYLRDVNGKSDVRFSCEKSKKAKDGDLVEVTLQQFDNVEVHYVLGNPTQPLNVQSFLELSVLSSETGSLLEQVCKLVLTREDANSDGTLFELIADKEQMKVHVRFPEASLVEAQERVHNFTADLYKRVEDGRLTFWAERRVTTEKMLESSPWPQK